MNENLVLFSPIGRSDPIRGNFDGPFLHIIRNYKPKKHIFSLPRKCGNMICMITDMKKQLNQY